MDLTTCFLVLVRVSTLLAVFPLFTGPNFPLRLRLGLSVLIAFLIAPSIGVFSLSNVTFPRLVALILVEAGIGLLLGFVSRMVFFAVEAAGNIVATEMGLNLGTTFNPMSNTRSEVTGMILYYLTAMIFLSLDMHHWLLVCFQRTYNLLPIGGAQLKEALLNDLISRSSNLFLAGLLMASPMIAISFLINLIMAVLARAVPHMNVFAESFAFRTLGGLAVFGLTLNLMAQHVLNYVRRLPDDIGRVAQLLGGG
jgi:flagellar biosynthetic protein FliR